MKIIKEKKYKLIVRLYIMYINIALVLGFSDQIYPDPAVAHFNRPGHCVTSCDIPCHHLRNIHQNTRLCLLDQVPDSFHSRVHIEWSSGAGRYGRRLEGCDVRVYF